MHDSLQQPRQPMPGFVREALEAQGLMQDYIDRPAYQRNDYLGWINQAKRQITKSKRLAQMFM